MQTNVEKLPKSTLKLTVTVPSEKVKQAYEKILTDVVNGAEIPGFRKGRAPKEMVLEKTDVSSLYGEVVNELLKTYYSQALKEHLIQPIANPKVEIKEFDLDKDFTFIATIATKPDIKIGDFRKKIKEQFEKLEKQDKTLNEERLRKGEKLEDVHIHLTVANIIDNVVEVTEVELPEILIEDEIDRMLSRLVNQAESIGLSLDQYMKSQNKTSEQLRGEYKTTAEKNLKSELALSKLVSDEKIEVSDKEIEEMIIASGDKTLMDQMQNDTEKWYIKSVLAKNKLISQLINEAEGEKAHDHK
ncbi:hypothetical protein A3H26_00890 [candidate division WWE3 bacterium RIFCSPLOWO2_12_FULL_36_10]|uniref:Trigger factor n=1 Tax=candidate division WWE3 bacterium RIFCSPLOWO2_12_FULL_36_10 TaxID=1802630 RepID=A0A1F4VKV0_UNCKA|nr:MAG: hypothetical protein A3H26_00890 [candidate division WWE3 bacterium RIFCSPLOWO2_12_FULL_36_10]